MEFADGTLIHVGDRIRATDSGLGEVVADIDNGEYSPRFPAREWSHLGQGILVMFDDQFLVHFSTPGLETFERVE